MKQDSISDLLKRLDQLNQIGAALSQERDHTRLMEMILEAAKTITNADGGTLYRMSEDRKSLRFEILQTDSLHLKLGGTTGSDVTLPNLQLFDEHGKPNDALVATYAVNHKTTVNIADVYNATNGNTHFDFSGTHRFDARTGYRSQSFLAVPMKSHEGDVIGVLQLINAKPYDSATVMAFSEADQSLAESLASQAAIAMSNAMLSRQLEDLFESFINVINLAIDDKSPHTGGHCQRVPELTMMLAEAAHKATQGPLASFVMEDRDRYELKIAGLMHDCGKVTTPVHVVDKATKLQTIYDRIGLIDTRFEVLKRDEEIAALRQQLTLRPVVNAQEEAALSIHTQTRMETMDEDREFLRRSNRGSESMPAADLQRVRDISHKYQWRNGQADVGDFLDPDELENLTIRAGTLTQSEREIINHHIVATNKMLEQLPWPCHLRNVPEYAGGHHERMDGKGYPKGLTKDQMSVQARVMGIADIFEALTACDRPYKSGMKLSQAMGILHKFSRNGHIDPDLFNIFVEHGLYRIYADKFLQPWQIDEVNPQDWQ